MRNVRMRLGQKLPEGSWNEVILLAGPEAQPEEVASSKEQVASAEIRLGLPVYTKEPGFNKLRSMVKRMIRAGFVKWEASDLATLRMLKALGITDITGDWTLYAFNSAALKLLSSLGVKRFVASPENTAENNQYLAESGYEVEFLEQQSTPLFISLNRPEEQTELAVYPLGPLYITTKKTPRTFTWPRNAVHTRVDLSWDASL